MNDLSPSVYHFSDYRDFLIAHSDAKKESFRGWSYALWAKKLNLSGTASLTMVLNGQRNAGELIVQKLVKYFSFSEEEEEYFRNLVKLEKYKRDPEHFFNIAKKIRENPYRKKRVMLSDDKLRALSSWYYYAIREMAKLKSFELDPEKIASQLFFKTSVKKIKTAIEDLRNLGLLSVSDDGKLSSDNPQSIDTGSEIASEYIKRLHEQLIELSAQSVRKFDVCERSLNAMTLTMKKENLPKVKALIEKFQDDLCDLVEEKNGDSTFQCNIQFFPLAEELKEIE